MAYEDANKRLLALSLLIALVFSTFFSLTSQESGGNWLAQVDKEANDTGGGDDSGTQGGVSSANTNNSIPTLQNGIHNDLPGYIYELNDIDEVDSFDPQLPEEVPSEFSTITDYFNGTDWVNGGKYYKISDELYARVKFKDGNQWGQVYALERYQGNTESELMSQTIILDDIFSDPFRVSANISIATQGQVYADSFIKTSYTSFSFYPNTSKVASTEKTENSIHWYGGQNALASSADLRMTAEMSSDLLYFSADRGIGYLDENNDHILEMQDDVTNRYHRILEPSGITIYPGTTAPEEAFYIKEIEDNTTGKHYSDGSLVAQNEMTMSHKVLDFATSHAEWRFDRDHVSSGTTKYHIETQNSQRKVEEHNAFYHLPNLSLPTIDTFIYESISSYSYPGTDGSQVNYYYTKTEGPNSSMKDIFTGMFGEDNGSVWLDLLPSL